MRRERTPRGLSIRTKLTAGVLVAALAPLAVVGFLSSEKQEREALENAFERLEGIATAQVGQLEAMVNADREIADILVTQTAVRDGLSMAPTSDIEVALSSAVREIARLDSASVVDVNGIVIATSSLDAVDRAEDITSRRADADGFEGVVIEGTDGTPVVMSVTPVLVDGEVVGRVVIETSIDPITTLATNYEGLSETGETSVAQRTIEGDAEFVAPLRFREGAVLNMTVPAEAARAPITMALAGESTRFEGVPDYRQQQVLAVTRAVEATGWGVVVKIDRAEALASMSAFRTTLLWATIVGALLVSLFAVFFARWITRPIQRLTEAAVGVADGDLAARADVRSRDEIGVLADAVDTMTDTLVDSVATEAGRMDELLAVNAQLAASDARVRSIVDNAAEGIVTCDEQGIIQTANRAAGSLFGRNPASLVGQPFGSFVGLSRSGDDVDADELPVPNLLEWAWDREEEIVGLFARCISGERVPIRMAVSRVDDADMVSFTALVRDVSESVEFERRLWESVNYDGLTGLPNRELFLSELDDALLASRTLTGRAETTMLSVLFIDLDRFKVVNDAWGHSAGDQLLQLVALRLRNAIREDDVLARFGGDEFVLMARTDVGTNDAVELGRRIIQELETAFRLGDHVTYVGASVGVSHADTANVSADDLVSQADVAMYGAKAAGRGRVSVFDAAMRERVQSRHDLHTDLRGALDRGDLEVHYQPIVCLDTGEFRGAEALVRWDHPTRGMVAPSDFIPLAEETGLIVDVGRIVLQKVARQIAEWDRHPGGSPRISVNLSAREIVDPKIVETVLDLLRSAGAKPDSLTVEVTEGVLVADADAAIENLRRLRAAGVSIALDDFGTGYSSLNYLRDMPVDIVKIDRRFVSELGDSTAKSSITAMVLGLGATMGLTVIAEGIETSGQHERLVEIGGTHAQGFLYARPAPAADVANLFWPADRAVDIESLQL